MRTLWIGGILLLCVGAAGAQPLGDDFQVNTLTLGYQDGVDIGVAADDSFVVVWHSPVSDGDDDSSNSIQARRYSGDGTPLGVEFQVNTFTINFQGWPAVAVAPSGDFVVVWSSEQGSVDTSGASIQAQRFQADGSPVGSQFLVNTQTTYHQTRPDVAVDSNGDFVVVWQSQFDTTGDDDDDWSVQGQRFAANGTPRGGQFQVNSYTTYGQTYPTVSMSDAGDFVVVWQSYTSGDTDTDGLSTLGQRFAANGTLQGAEFQVNTYTTADQYGPVVAVASDVDGLGGGADNDYYGTGSGIDGDGAGVLARRYSAAGAPLGDPFMLNTYTTNQQRLPFAAFDSSDRFVVTWTSFGSSGTDDSWESIQARQYEADGEATGPEFQVNSHTPGTQYNAKMGFGSEGRFVVAWAGYTSPGDDDNGSAPIARRFQYDKRIFTDGFESGDLSAWSSTVP